MSKGITPDNVTVTDLYRALKVVEAYGARRLCKTARNEASTGCKLGLALASANDAPVVVDTAIAALEDWDAHLSVAVLSVIEQGKGTYKRKGRKLTVTLPEHWAKI